MPDPINQSKRGALTDQKRAIKTKNDAQEKDYKNNASFKYEEEEEEFDPNAEIEGQVGGKGKKSAANKKEVGTGTYGNTFDVMADKYTPDEIERIQEAYGVEQTGKWDKATHAKYEKKVSEMGNRSASTLAGNKDKYDPESVKAIQGHLGVEQDGKWGKNTQAAHEASIRDQSFDYDPLAELGGEKEGGGDWLDAIGAAAMGGLGKKGMGRHNKARNMEKGGKRGGGGYRPSNKQSNSDKVKANLKRDMQRKDTSMNKYRGGRGGTPDYVSLQRPKGALTG